ncbi:MAG TPA: hypothetical protein VF765_08555, partial [Polyangiaceae bacterium]
MILMRIASGLLLAGALASAGCASAAIGEGARTLAKALVSDEDEARLGAQLHDELLNKEHVKLLDDPDVTQYLEGITRPIFEQAKRDRPGVSWTLYIIDDP